MLLASSTELRQLVRPVDGSSAALQAVLAHAAQLKDRLSIAEHRRAITATILRRVQLLDHEVAIHVDRTALLRLLGPAATPDLPPLILSAPAARVRSGKEIRLVLTGDDAPAARNAPLASLIAEAHAFRDVVLSSPDETVDQIARRLGRCRSRSAKLIRLSFLAPDIVSAVLTGEPVTFGVRQLLQQALPSRW